MQDQEILLICEDMMSVFQNKQRKSSIDFENVDGSPLARRFSFILERIETERRLIEEISRPGRLLFEHFSVFLERMDYTIGFICGDIKTGRGMLSNMRIGEWGVISIEIGDIKVTWRDVDVNYMFYQDSIIVRPKDSSQVDIKFFFSYLLKYNRDQLKRFQDVAEDEQTLYWHKDLTIITN